MAEYIDRKSLLKHLEETIPDNDWLVSQFNADWIYSFIESPLAADVVPREEVDRLRHILNSYALQYGTVKDQQAAIDRIKTETAREIFEGIEKWLPIIDYPIIAELKKKYTEEDG